MGASSFQLMGDMSHLAAIVLLPIKLQWSRSASGVSLKTQELYLLVFLTRYTDLFFQFVSPYNRAMKVLFISYTAVTIAMLRCQPSLKASYDASADSFRLWGHAVAPSYVLAMAIYVWYFGMQMNSVFVFRTFLWTFSELLEALAIVPQLMVLNRCRDAGVLTWCYVSLMAVYRALYAVVWVWTAADNPWYMHHHVLYFAAMTQTCFYVVFFTRYFVASPSMPVNDNGIMETSSCQRQGLLQAPLSLSSHGSFSPTSFSEDPDEEGQQQQRQRHRQQGADRVNGESTGEMKEESVRSAATEAVQTGTEMPSSAGGGCDHGEYDSGHERGWALVGTTDV